MIISRTPFRISFAGGGSDMPDFYRQYGGAVVSITITKYVYLSMHPYFNKTKYFLKYSKNELVDRIEEIEHRIVRQVFLDYEMPGVDFNSSADIPAGTGLASSSAFTVGLINLSSAYKGIFETKDQIAEHACKVEIEKLCEPIGKQDQYACALGGLNYIQFNEDDSVSHEKIILRPDSARHMEQSLMVFYLGCSRSASRVLSEQKSNMQSQTEVVNNLKKMVALAKTLRYELQKNVDCLGPILNEGWELKKGLASSISNSGIDHYYKLAMCSGATGGKLLGAGGGGFLLFYVPDPERRDSVRGALQNLPELDFRIDSTGTSIIYAD